MFWCQKVLSSKNFFNSKLILYLSVTYTTQTQRKPVNLKVYSVQNNTFFCYSTVHQPSWWSNRTSIMVLDLGINSRDAPPDLRNLFLLCNCFSNSLQCIPRICCGRMVWTGFGLLHLSVLITNAWIRLDLDPVDWLGASLTVTSSYKALVSQHYPIITINQQATA